MIICLISGPRLEKMRTFPGTESKCPSIAAKFSPVMQTFPMFLMYFFIPKKTTISLQMVTFPGNRVPKFPAFSWHVQVQKQAAVIRVASLRGEENTMPEIQEPSYHLTNVAVAPFAIHCDCTIPPAARHQRCRASLWRCLRLKYP